MTRKTTPTLKRESVTFADLKPKRLTQVRETIAEMWGDGFRAPEIAKKVKVSTRSVATALGNLTRNKTTNK